MVILTDSALAFFSQTIWGDGLLAAAWMYVALGFGISALCSAGQHNKGDIQSYSILVVSIGSIGCCLLYQLNR